MNSLAAFLVCAMSVPAVLPVRGIVVGADNRPVAGADVYLSGYFNMTDAPLHTQTGEQGDFTIAETSTKQADWKQRGFQLVACKSGVGFEATFINGSRSDPASQPISLKLKPAAPIRMQVRDPQGKPVVNTEVQLILITDPRTWSMQAYPAPHFQVRTNAAGDATFDIAPAKSRIKFRIRTEAYGTQLQGVTAESPVFQLRPVGKVRGTLQVAKKKSMQGLPLIVLSTAPREKGKEARGSTGLAEVTTDAEGSFEVPALAAGDIRILKANDRLNTSSYILPQEVRSTLAAGETKQVDVPVDRAIRLVGKIVAGTVDGNPVAGVKLHLQGNAGDERFFDLFQITGQDGVFECAGAPGVVFVTIRDVPAGFIKPRDIGPVSLQPGDDVKKLDPIVMQQRATP